MKNWNRSERLEGIKERKKEEIRTNVKERSRQREREERESSIEIVRALEQIEFSSKNLRRNRSLGEGLTTCENNEKKMSETKEGW